MAKFETVKSINLSFLKSSDEINGKLKIIMKTPRCMYTWGYFFHKADSSLCILGFRLSFHFYGLRKQQAAAQRSKNRCEKMQ